LKIETYEILAVKPSVIELIQSISVFLKPPIRVHS